MKRTSRLESRGSSVLDIVVVVAVVVFIGVACGFTTVGGSDTDVACAQFFFSSGCVRDHMTRASYEPIPIDA